MDPLNTDFTDTSDVSDAGLEFVGGLVGYITSARNVRKFAEQGDPEGRLVILLTRLIKEHRPDLIPDPVVLKVREIMAEQRKAGGYSPAIVKGWREGKYDTQSSFAFAQAVYLQGVADGEAK